MLFINNPILELNNYIKAIEYSCNICDALSIELNKISYISAADKTIINASKFYQNLEECLKDNIIIKKARKKLYENEFSVIDKKDEEKYYIIKTYYKINDNSINLLKSLNKNIWNTYLKSLTLYQNGQVFLERTDWDLVRVNSNNMNVITRFIEIFGKGNVLKYCEDYRQKLNNAEKIVTESVQKSKIYTEEKDNFFTRILLYGKNIKFDEFIDYAFNKCDAISLTTNKLEIEGNENRLQKANNIETNTIKELKDSYICTKKTSKWKYKSAYKYVENLEKYNCTINFYKTTDEVKDYIKQFKAFFNFSSPYPEDITFYKQGKVWGYLDSNKEYIMMNIENEKELEMLENLLNAKINFKRNDYDNYIDYM